MPISLGLVGLVVEDMGESLRFYRRLGLAIPENVEGEPHVELRTDGLTLFWDTKELVRSFDPVWEEPSGGGRRVVLEFVCEGPGDVELDIRSSRPSGTKVTCRPSTPPGALATRSSTTRTATR